MATNIDICNLALAHLGEAQIVSLVEDNARAAACNLRYAFVRDEVLRAHRWNFAQKRAGNIAQLTVPAFGWAASYLLPDDCLRVCEFNGTEEGQIIGNEYIIEGRAILTNATTVNIVYISREEDVSKYDSIFINALALKLAAALTENIRGTSEKSGDLMAAYERITSPLARRVDANEGRRRKGMIAMNSSFINARYGDYWDGFRSR